MNRSFTKSAWNNLNRQEQRVAAANMEVVSVLAKRMGATINIVDTITTADGQRANGRYNPQTGQIDIALNADAKAYAYVAMHELTHQLKAEHEAHWGTFSGWVQEALNEKGQNFDQLVQYQMENFGLSEADAAEEVICNTVPAILQDEGTLRSLYQQDKSLFEKVMDWVRSLIDDIKAAGKALSERSESWRQMGALAVDVGTLQGLYDVMESIMQSERTNTGDNSAVKASRQDSGGSKHYDYSKPFSEQVEDWTNGLIPKRDTLVLGRTPLVFRQVGLSDIPMTMDQTHLDYAVNGTKNPDHYWGKEGIKQLPELLKNPIAIIESATHPDNSIVAIVDAKVNGKDAMAAVRISNQGKINGHPIDANHMVNTQGRGNTISKLLADAIKKEDAKQIGVFYIDKEKGLSILKRAGLQLPGSLNQGGLIHSIFDAGSPVNADFMKQTDTRQFGEWFAGSQVVNSDGTPKIMYHGTATEFWAFDKKKANDMTGRRLGLGAGKGKFYLTEYKGSAQLAADSAQQTGRGNSPKVMELYVSAQKVMDRSEYDQRLKEAYKQYPNSDPRGDVYDYRQRDKAIAAVDKAIIKDGYDGVWDRESGEMFVYDSTQIKSAIDNIGLFDRKNPDIRYSRSDYKEAQKKYAGVDLSTDSSVYTYDFLTSLPDMETTQMATEQDVKVDGRVDQTYIVRLSLANASTFDSNDGNGVSVKNNYTGRKLRLTTKALRHSLRRENYKGLLANAKAVVKVGELAQRALPFNALFDTSTAANGTYAMGAYLVDENQNEYIAILTVEQRSGDVVEMEVYDTLHALSTRKRSAVDQTIKTAGAAERQHLTSPTRSIISIAELLEIVNETHQSLLSEDVLDHFGEERNPAGYYSDRVKFSLSDYDDTVREGENVLEELLTMTAAHRMTDAEAARVARKVLKAASSEMDLDEATQRIKSIFDYASRSGNRLDMQGLSSEATALAEDMLSESKTLDMQHEEDCQLRYQQHGWQVNKRDLTKRREEAFWVNKDGLALMNELVPMVKDVLELST